VIPPQVSLGGWVAPFGDPGIADRSHLPRAFRSVPRPSSPLSAKASTRCPSLALDPGGTQRLNPRLNLRLTQGLTPGVRRTKPPRTAARPHSGRPALGRPRMKTLVGHIQRPPLSQGQALRRACPPRSHDKLSLYPSNNTPAPGLAPGTASLSSPNADGGGADGGGERIRTDDLLLAKQALSQLSYTPLPEITDQKEIRTRRSEI
jgi:hypothetical protein